MRNGRMKMNETSERTRGKGGVGKKLVEKREKR